LSIGVRLCIGIALAACGWSAADGLRRAKFEPLSRVYLPWDADRLPESASDARVLALRPVSTFSRVRDALTRADDADGDGFRRACRGVLRWGRVVPGALLELGSVALHRGFARDDAADREVGEALLLEYVARTTHDPDEAVRAWLEAAAAGADAFAVFSRAPRSAWPWLAVPLVEAAPESAWRLFARAALDGTVDGARHGASILALARARRRPEDVPVLDALLVNATVSPETAEGLRSLRADLAPAR
jgi:hypothetical protein